MKLIEFIRGRPFIVYNTDDFIPSNPDEYAVEAWERQKEGLKVKMEILPGSKKRWYEMWGMSWVQDYQPDYKLVFDRFLP